MSLDFTPAEKCEYANPAYLIFSVGNLHYAVKASYVIQITELQQITASLRAPPYILGVTKVHDAIYSVMDLRIRFGCNYHENSHPIAAIMLTYNGLKLCLVVDKVISVVNIAGATAIPKWVNPYITEVVQAAGMHIGLLSMDRLFSMDEFSV